MFHDMILNPCNKIGPVSFVLSGFYHEKKSSTLLDYTRVKCSCHRGVLKAIERKYNDQSLISKVKANIQFEAFASN